MTNYLLIALSLALTGCEALAAGGTAFGNHPLGPNPGGQPQRCLTNVQQHAVGANPYAYQTGYTTCGP